VGKKSNHAVPPDERDRIRRLFQEKYPNFNYRHFAERAHAFEGVTASYSTIKRILKPLNQVKRPKRSRVRRRYRSRKESQGLLLQMDGSDHEWLYGQSFCLIAGIDDATSEVPYGEFFPTESLEGYTRVLTGTFNKVGVPRAVYIDHASWLSGTTKTDESGQFKRMCDDLDIYPIYADSPEAKGRIERLWSTLQDRLVAELQLYKVATMSEANRYLNEVFLPHWNKNFTIKPQKTESLYRRPPSATEVEEIFALHYERKIRNDETILWNNGLYQSNTNFGYSIAKRTAEIRVYSDGTMKGFYAGKDLALTRVRRVEDDMPQRHKNGYIDHVGLETNLVKEASLKRNHL
jgi:hypothetical protein